MDMDHLFVRLGEGADTVVGAAHGVLSGAADLLEALGVVIFEVGAFLEEEGEFLREGVRVGFEVNRGVKGNLLVRMLCCASND